MAKSKSGEQTQIAEVEVLSATDEEPSGSSLKLMTPAEAKRCVEAIKHHAVSLRELLVELAERRGWQAIGYKSITACLVGEFQNSKPVLVRELKTGRIEKNYLQVPIGTYLESQLRPLSKLSSPQQYQSTIAKAHQLAGKQKLTATHIAQAVNQTLLAARQPNLAAKYKSGDLVRIECQAGALSDQKAWDGCWGIVHSTGNISAVSVTVGSKEINYMAGDLDWDDNSETQFRSTCERILTLWQVELEPIERTVLKELQRRHFFTNLEEEIIALMENKHLKHPQSYLLAKGASRTQS